MLRKMCFSSGVSPAFVTIAKLWFPICHVIACCFFIAQYVSFHCIGTSTRRWCVFFTMRWRWLEFRRLQTTRRRDWGKRVSKRKAPLAGGFKRFYFQPWGFDPIWGAVGEMIQFEGCICFKWGGSTTKWLRSCFCLTVPPTIIAPWNRWVSPICCFPFI